MDLFQLYGCLFQYIFLGRSMFLLPIAVYSYMRNAYIRNVHKIRKTIVSSVISVCPLAWNNLAPNGRILKEFETGEFFENLSRKFKFR